MRLQEQDYRVDEGAGTVTVCVERIGESDIDITLTVNARESTPVSAMGM